MICAFFCPVPEVLARISQHCEIFSWTALFPSPSLQLCDGEDGDEKELVEYLLVNSSELSRVVIGIGIGMMQSMMMVTVPIKSLKELTLELREGGKGGDAGHMGGIWTGLSGSAGSAG